MEIKNARYTNEENTLIDVEIEHPAYGWIPYTFNTLNEDTSFDTEIRAWLETATVQAYVPPTKTEAQIIADKVAEYKDYLASTDYIVTKIAEAQALGEDTTLLLSKYAVELQQRKEARAFIGANS